MAQVDKRDVIRVLREIAGLLELKGESVYKTRAYERAADTLGSVHDDLGKLVEDGKLEDLPGIGKSLAEKISELVRTGKSQFHQDLLADYPATLLEVVKVAGMGPKKTAALWHQLHISTPAELEDACKKGLIRGLKGFGEKTEASILEGLAALTKRGGRTPLARARPMAEAALEHVRRAPGVVRAELGGSTRRFSETVGDLDMVASVTDMKEAEAVMHYFTDFPGVEKVLGTGPTKTSVVLDNGLQLDLRVITDPDFATALHHFTGSKAHHIKLRELARQQHLTISEWGIHKLKPDGSQGAKLTINDEPSLYAALGLPYIPPEMREDHGELEAAQAGKLPDLITQEDLRGITHAHTTYSDGHNSLEEMAKAAAALGVKYLTITDHSQAATYAGGLNEDRLKKQWEEIDRVNEQKLGARLLKGSEVDILEDGTLDFPDALLAKLEVVIGSIHTRFKMDVDQMTARISRAFDNPHLHIWGHATGRLIGEREPYAVHMEQLLDKAAKKGVAVEINGTPERLDLSAAHARLAHERGVKLVLSTDAHSVGGLANLRFAVGTARRAWVEKKDVLTRLEAQPFVEHLRTMRH